MRHKILTLIFALFIVGALFFAASGRMATRYVDISQFYAEPERATSNSDRRMVDMIADDSYLIDNGDSTLFILVGNFAAHHNGAVILADSAVRYSNQSFECFGNVLINQNTTYVYGDRAEYNHNNSTATIYSDLVKVVDGDAVMYTYHCTFDTEEEVGEFHGGCYVDKGESHMESERGYYNTKTHDLIAVDRVQMRDESYLMTGDSVIFNTETENARYFRNTNIWNDKEEYLFANEGTYTKALDLHSLTRDAYLLSPEREVWSDSIDYYRTAGHIIGRNNIQIDDSDQKILGFADYGEWWDEPGNALFTRRPSMISYDPEQGDSLFISADTLWMYTISAYKPEPDPATMTGEGERDSTNNVMPGGERKRLDDNVAATEQDAIVAEEEGENADQEQLKTGMPDDVKAARDSMRNVLSNGMPPREGGPTPPDMREMGPPPPPRGEKPEGMRPPMGGIESMPGQGKEGADAAPIGGGVVATQQGDAEVVVEEQDASSEENVEASDSVTAPKKELTKKQLRYRAKLERRRVRDSIRAEKRAVRDSLKLITDAENDSIRKIRDSVIGVKLDTLIARRIARSSRIADEEKARMERVKQKSEEHRRRKIDKAKARALKRGKEYKGEDYVIDSLAADSLRMPQADAQMNDSLAMADNREVMPQDTLANDSTLVDSTQIERGIPKDSVYKLIKAYSRVKMYRPDSQVVCDSMTILNTDSIIRLYKDPVMWNEKNQITADSMAIHTKNQVMEKAYFMGDPLMGTEIDTMYYNQVKGKEMIAYFSDGSVYRNDVNGNAQTIYYMQEEEGSTVVTGLMYIESAAISFYLTDGEMDKIVYKQNPDYVLYPMAMIPETQDLYLKDFKWQGDRRPSRDSVCMRIIRHTRRSENLDARKPQFRITERIDYDRRRLVENRVWVDRLDELTPEVVEWRNSRASYQKRQ